MLNYEFPPLGGGSANATYYLLDQFAREQSLEIDLVTSAGGMMFETEQFAENIRVYRLPVGKKAQHFWTMSEIARWTWSALFASRKLRRENDYDLVHCWSGWPSGVVGLASSHRLPFVVGLRGSDVPGYNERVGILDSLVFRHLSRVVWSAAASVTAVSNHLRDLARRTSERVDIDVIHNGVDSSQFTPGESPERFTVLYVGRLIRRKGVMNLVRAFREILRKVPDASLLLVGDGPERLPLQEYCRRAGIDRSVSFLGVVDHKELPSIFKRASVFVMPALEEAMPNAMLEAMASGLALITTDTGAREMIDGNGIIVEPGSDEAISRAIEVYVDDSELLARHRLRSRELAERTSWSKVAESYLEIYERSVVRRDVRLALTRT
jgi:glycosyltransferase involved in cell wall biosynthesis